MDTQNNSHRAALPTWTIQESKEGNFLEFDCFKGLISTQIALEAINKEQKLSPSSTSIIFKLGSRTFHVEPKVIENALGIAAEEIEEVNKVNSSNVLKLIQERINLIWKELGAIKTYIKLYNINENEKTSDEEIADIIKFIEFHKSAWMSSESSGYIMIKKQKKEFPALTLVADCQKRIYIHFKKLLDKGQCKKVIETYDYTNRKAVVRLKPLRQYDYQLDAWDIEIRASQILLKAQKEGADLSGITIPHSLFSFLKNPELGDTDDNKRYLAYEERADGDLYHSACYATNQEKLHQAMTAAYGIATLHKLGIVSRDIKLENLLKFKTHQVSWANPKLSIGTVTDFGLATANEPQIIKDCCGTMGYWAPEHWRDALKYRKKKLMDQKGMSQSLIVGRFL